MTFTKNESSTYTFYNDIKFVTLNVYIPDEKYAITIAPFSVKSVGDPIVVTIKLQVASSTSFSLLTSNDCGSGFVFNPAERIEVGAEVTSVSFTVAYKGTTIPPPCTQKFSISSISNTNYFI